MFFTSVRIPKGSVPRRRSETFASTRIWPFSISASETSIARSRSRSSSAYRRACSAVRISGSVTISMSGTPARLKSTRLTRVPSVPAAWTSLAVSSSRWARAIPIVTSPPVVSNVRDPWEASGRSYWLIW